MDYENVRKKASNAPGSLNKDGAGIVSSVSLSNLPNVATKMKHSV